MPVQLYNNPFLPNAYIALCEVLNPDGSPHVSNTRCHLNDDDDWWFGFEQEYVLEVNNRPIGFPDIGYPKPQGDFYCGSGPNNVAGREIADAHLELCLEAGLNITGTNAEVMIGQWEYQCFGEGAKRASDDLWVSRYIMQRLTERYNVNFNLHPKPVAGDWNGSGMHTNFSNNDTRNIGGNEMLIGMCKKLEQKHTAHINVYGSNNDMRLTGLHETQHINSFSYGVSDRGASIRIPIATVENDWKGYLEDRRPASNADPYQVVKVLIDTLS
jgi:glutamine synthetase